MESRAKLPLIVAAFIAIYVIWGSTYLLNKVAIAELPPFMLATIRFITAGCLIFGIAAAMKLSLKITAKQIWNALIAGILFLSFGNGVVVWALKYVDSNFAALIISAQPLIVMFLMWALQGQRIKSMALFGVFLGIVGIYLLVSQDSVHENEDAWIGIAMIFSAMLAWAYGSLFVGKADFPKNFFVNTGYQMLLGGLVLGLTSLVIGEPWSNPMEWQSATLWSMLLLILFGSIIAFTSFNFLLKTVSPEKVSTNTYVNPIVAMLLGNYFLHEPVSGQSILAAVVLLTGVYFISTNKSWNSLVRFRRKGI
jgi:drug/metabolite transporter (DMT)-like permease